MPRRREGTGGKSHTFTVEEKYVGFPGAGGSRVPAPGKLFPSAGERSHSLTIKEKCVSFPGAGEAVSRRRENCFPAPGKGHSLSVDEKCVGFPAPGEAVSRRRKVLERGSGEVPEQGSGGSVGFRAGAEKAVSRHREKVTFIHYRRKRCRFSRRWGKLCPGAGKAVSRRPGKVTFVQRRRKV